MTPDEVDALVQDGFPAAYRGGYRCVRLGEGWAEGRWIYDPISLRPGGYISGPVLFGLADVTLWFATFTVLGPAPMAVTSELSMTFLLPAIGGDVLARAEILRTGRTAVRRDQIVDGDPTRSVGRTRHGKLRATQSVTVALNRS
jgi:uncharacterized protein (TIGR00369 family)